MRPSAVLLAALLLAAAPARADEGRAVLVVLDRGSDAASSAETDGTLALKIVRALEARGAPVLLLAAGAGENGRLLLTAPTPTKAGLRALAAKEGFAHSGPTDLRGVLGPALVGREPTTPLDVLLVGPFSGPAEGATARRELAMSEAVPTWNEQAPAESRLFAPGASEEALALLEGARGLQTDGWLVLGFARPQADTQPFSPLPLPQAGLARLEAHVHTAAQVIALAAGETPPPLLTADTDLPDDEVTRTTAESLQSFRVQRVLRDGRTATVSFRAAAAEGVTWLCDPPSPLTFSWERLAPDASLQAPDGGVQPVFEAVGAEVGTPVVRSFRLLRTRAGRRPAWTAGAAVLPEGLRWSLGTETALTDDVFESELRVAFHAQPATPLAVEGTLELSADGMPVTLKLPYVLKVAPGRATFTLDAQPVALPIAAADPPSRLRFTAQNANVPAALPIEAACDTDHAPWLRGVLRGADGRETPWTLAEPLAVATGGPHTLRFERLPDAPDDLVWPCTVTIRPAPIRGVEVAGEGTVEVRLRQPRLVREGEALELVVEDGVPHAVAPLILRLDADGGDGDWLLALVRIPPTVTTLAGDVERWEVLTREPGLWHVHPAGPWTGAEPEAFEDRQAQVRLHIAWTVGAAPAPIEAPVSIPARWGARGWMFVGLAALALLLGVTVFLQMRAPRVVGTLLYVVDDMPGTVGRLDLRPVGRRAVAVFADGRGRLSLRGGTTMVARIRPTRVGGMLEVAGEVGESERRLLVDGLAVRAGRHKLRYVSGQPAENEATAAMVDVPDLLGDEFDIESGRIESL